MVRFRDVLKNKDFSKLWAGQIISNFGDALNQMALIALANRVAPGSTIELAKLLFFIIIPVFIIGPVAGVYADRWDKKRVMIVSDVLRGILVLFIPAALFLFESLIPVYIIVFLVFSLTRFFIPSKMAIIPELVPKHMLLVANTLSDTTRVIATLSAYAVAGFIVEQIGDIGGFYLNAVSYFLSAACISTMGVGGFGRELKEGLVEARKALKAAIRKSIWAEIKEGIRQLVGNEDMRFVIRTWFFLMSGVGAISTVLIVFIQETFGSAAKHVSLHGAFLVLGAFAGMVIYGRYCQSFDKRKAVVAGVCLGGIAITLFGAILQRYPLFWTGMVLMAFLGMSSGPIIISLNTMAHESISGETRGRGFSSIEAVIHLGFLIFMVLAAYLAELAGNGDILIVSGAAFAVWGVCGLLFRRIS